MSFVIVTCIEGFTVFTCVHRPDQPLDLINNYMMDKLTGESAPRLHLVSFDASEDIKASLTHLATESHGHFHSYCSQPSSSEGEETTHSIEDTDITRVREEIVKTQEVLCNLKSMEHGALGSQIVEILREVCAIMGGVASRGL